MDVGERSLVKDYIVVVVSVEGAVDEIDIGPRGIGEIVSFFLGVGKRARVELCFRHRSPCEGPGPFLVLKLVILDTKVVEVSLADAGMICWCETVVKEDISSGKGK